MLQCRKTSMSVSGCKFLKETKLMEEPEEELKRAARIEVKLKDLRNVSEERVSRIATKDSALWMDSL